MSETKKPNWRQAERKAWDRYEGDNYGMLSNEERDAHDAGFRAGIRAARRHAKKARGSR